MQRANRVSELQILITAAAFVVAFIIGRLVAGYMSKH